MIGSDCAPAGLWNDIEMSIIKIEDIAYVRFNAPDLAEMGRFLVEFGLHLLPRQGDTLYARGTGSAPFLHATTLGPPGFGGLGLRAESVADLERLAAAEGSNVENLLAPGGGKVVHLLDPDGWRVELIAGQTPAQAMHLQAETPRNSAHTRPRLRTPVRLKEGPSRVVRLGHAVLSVRDFAVSAEWYRSRFGFIPSDEVQLDTGAIIGAFLRCDRGDEPTDHHTLFLFQAPDAPAFAHAAFEVEGLDDLMRGHTHLQRARRTPAWGIGRHIFGSQIFDYWKDPWGHELEHWTDGDLCTAADPTHKVSIKDLVAVQWGPQHPHFGNPGPNGF